MEEETDIVLMDFHPRLRPYIKVLLTHEFGLLRDLPKIHNIKSGNIIMKNQIPYGDRFELRITYCRKPLYWYVLMNGNCVSNPPDIIMEENFLAGITSDEINTKVPSLANWQPSNAKCLLNVILELLELYKSYQVNLLRINQSFHRYLFEYDTLVSMAGIESQDVEVCIDNMIGTAVVNFIINLNIDFSKMPMPVPDIKTLVLLLVEFKDNCKPTVQIVPRLEIQDFLGDCIELPDLSPETSLMDYVPALEEIIQSKLDQYIFYIHQRKLLYCYLVQFFEPALIEGDNLNFRKVSFLLESDGFFCILNVNIPLEYPEVRPGLQLLTLQKTADRNSDYSGYQFNQNMTHEEVARNIFTFVKETAIAEFQKNVVFAG